MWCIQVIFMWCIQVCDKLLQSYSGTSTKIPAFTLYYIVYIKDHGTIRISRPISVKSGRNLLLQFWFWLICAITLNNSDASRLNFRIFFLTEWIIVSHRIVKEMSISTMKLRIKRSQFYLLGRKYHSVSKLQIPLVDQRLHTYLFGDKEAEITEHKGRDHIYR